MKLPRFFTGKPLDERETFDRHWYRIIKQRDGSFSVASHYLPGAGGTEIEWGIDEIHSLEDADAQAKKMLTKHLRAILADLEAPR